MGLDSTVDAFNVIENLEGKSIGADHFSEDFRNEALYPRGR